MLIGGYLSHFIDRGTFSLGNSLKLIQSLLRQYQAHTFLGFVADDLLIRECRVTYRKCIQVDTPPCLFYQFGKTIEVSASPMIMDRDNRVFFGFHKGTNGVGHTLLHLRVGTLDSIQLNPRAESPCIG